MGAKVGLVFGGRSVEHLVSVRSARTLQRGLREAGYDVVPLGIATSGVCVREAEAAAALRGECDVLRAQPGAVGPSLAAFLSSGVDVVFPIVHGTYGEDGTLQGLCELLDLPYVGPTLAASAIAMDKALAKALWRAAGVPVVDDVVVHAAAFAADADAVLAEARPFSFPVFVKPSVGGSSVGVRRAASLAELHDAVAYALGFCDRVLIERAIQGRELECAVLGFGALETSAIGEIVPGNAFYDYEDKYVTDGARLLAPAPLEPLLADRLRACARRACEAIGADGMARVDFFLTAERELFVNEINTLPGFTDISMYPRLWGLGGLSLPALVERLVEAARRRHTHKAALDAQMAATLEDLVGRLGPRQG